MSKWLVSGGTFNGGEWWARKVDDNNIASCSASFYGENAEEKCRAFAKAANQNPDGPFFMFPVPATGKWEKGFEWTGEVRQVKAGDFYLGCDGYVYEAEMNAGTFEPFYYILKKKEPQWEIGKAYWDKSKLCFYIRNINGAWLSDNGNQAQIMDDSMSEDIVTDQDLWNIARQISNSEDKSIAFMVKALKDLWFVLPLKGTNNEQ